MEQPLRTLLISPYFDAGLPSGGVLYSIYVAREWLNRGRQVHVICLDRSRSLGDLQSFVESGQLVLYPLAAEENSRFTHHPDKKLYAATAALIRQIQPEIVHAHNIQGMLSAIAAANDAGVPQVLAAVDLGLVCFNFCLYPQSPRVCTTPLSACHCAACIRRTIHGSARLLGPWLPRGVTRRIWPRFVRLDQIKLVNQLHAMMREVLTSLAVIVAPSPGVADTLRRFGGAGGNVRYLLNGIPAEKMVRPAKEPSNVLRFAYLGGTEPIKGFDTVVQAVQLLPRNLPLQIGAYGGDSLRKHIEALPPAARDYVDWRAPLFGRQLGLEHARIDAMLVPSIVHENSPYAELEALANGTPVLGSNHPGISHLIEPERNGWLIEPGDASAWAAAFTRAVNEPERLRAMQPTSVFARTIRDYVDDLEEVEIQAKSAKR